MRQYSIDHDTEAFEAYAKHNGVDVHAPGVVLYPRALYNTEPGHGPRG